jgi:hypothetical protein
LGNQRKVFSLESNDHYKKITECEVQQQLAVAPYLIIPAEYRAAEYGVADYGVASMMPISIYYEKINHDDLDTALWRMATSSHARVTCL